MQFTWLHLVSTIILILIVFGIVKRRDRKIHIPVMLAAFALDVLLVLVIELNRGAIETAVSHVDNTLLMFHIAISLGVLVLYGVLTWLGFKILKGDNSVLLLHKKLAYVFCILRLVNYVTSFMVVGSGDEHTIPADETAWLGF